jgi:solute carrier family 31 (copper transporter), member 1
MLWNWYTIDSCFIARSWHVKNKAMFAGSCIGVILLVISLEFLRRSVKEYDRYLLRQHVAKHDVAGTAAAATADAGSSHGSKHGDGVAAAASVPPFRPSVLQQAVRSFLHMCQFAVAYFIML